MDQEERIRRRAYEIWQQAGCPEGQQDAHWAEACRQIADEDQAREALGAPPLGDPRPEEMQSPDAPSDRSLAEAAEALRRLDEDRNKEETKSGMH